MAGVVPAPIGDRSVPGARSADLAPDHNALPRAELDPDARQGDPDTGRASI
jgi:hypothetical protein